MNFMSQKPDEEDAFDAFDGEEEEKDESEDEVDTPSADFFKKATAKKVPATKEKSVSQQNSDRL